MKNCSSEVTSELHQFYKTRNKVKGDFALYAQCYDDQELYVQGVPFAWSKMATVGVGFWPCENSTENGNMCASAEII